MRQTYFLRGSYLNMLLIELIVLLYSLSSIFLFQNEYIRDFRIKKLIFQKNKHFLGQFN